MEELAVYASASASAVTVATQEARSRTGDTPASSDAATQRDLPEDRADDQSSDRDEGSALSDSDEFDNSEDEDFTPDSQASDNDEEPLTAESGDSGGSGNEDDQDISIYVMDQDLHQQVIEIIRADKCDSRCCEGKTKELESMLCSLSTMSRDEKLISIYTLLGALMEIPVIESVDTVSARSFTTTCHWSRYKKHVRDGNIGVKAHGNTLNKNAAVVDLVWLVKWFKEFAEEVGEVVPVRVRMQKTKDGVVKKYYSSELYTLLPAHFTWDAIYDEMHTYVETIRLRVREPARSTMRKLLTLHCPTIRIRSPRTNVCDIRSIYHAGMRNNITAENTEILGRHTESARRMRREYKSDKIAASDDHAVIVMDFSQNLTIPSVSSTPSQWYFCSLLAVSCFGIFYENDDHFLKTKLIPEGKTRLTVYADNCSGQNKNNYVIKFLLAQVDVGLFKHIDCKFFVKGHTKNSCDRGFGHIRKHLATADCWTMDHVVEAVKNAASNSITVRIPRGSEQFKTYKAVLTELYKRLEGIQQFQIFSMDEDKPGVVSCRKGPDVPHVDKDLRRKIDGRLTTKEKIITMLSDHVDVLEPSPPNAEKNESMYHNIRPYVPEEFQGDLIYAKPSDQEGLDAKATKQARRAHRAAMAVAAKANQDRRGREVNEEETASHPSKKRKATED